MAKKRVKVKVSEAEAKEYRRRLERILLRVQTGQSRMPPCVVHEGAEVSNPSEHGVWVTARIYVPKIKPRAPRKARLAVVPEREAGNGS